MRSLNSRVLIAAALVLVAFLGSAGWVLDRAFRDSAMTSVRDRLQGQIFMLLGKAELDNDLQVILTAVFPGSRLSIPDSGNYAQIFDSFGRVVWRSRSMLGLSIAGPSGRAPGKFVFDHLKASTGSKLYSLSYTVLWEATHGKGTALFTVQVCENSRAYLRQIRRFRRSLWSWFVGIGIVLTVVQTAILRWGLKPLRDVAAEVREIEAGRKSSLSSGYPAELSALTTNLNALIRNNQSRVQRYRNALGDLAHSLKTPLAVLRSALDSDADAAQFKGLCSEQLQQLDATIQYQLQRAAAAGRQALGRPVDVKVAAERLAASLRKIYADRGIEIALTVEEGSTFFGDQGDLLEILGNIADNACKWARTRADIIISQDRSDAGSARPALRMQISDDGGGMPADKIQAVMARGARLDQVADGHGIGLAVVRELVEEIYDGSVGIQSRNGGTSVTVTLKFS